MGWTLKQKYLENGTLLGGFSLVFQNHVVGDTK